MPMPRLLAATWVTSSPFIQIEPDWGAPATEKTEVWVFYDASAGGPKLSTPNMPMLEIEKVPPWSSSSVTR